MQANYLLTTARRLYIRQLRALLWKSARIRRFHYISALFELLGPLLLIGAVAYLYASSRDDPLIDASSSFLPPEDPTAFSNPQFNITFSPEADFGHRPYTVFYAPMSEPINRLLYSLRNHHVSVIGFHSEQFLDDELKEAMHYRMGFKDMVGIWFENVTDREQHYLGGKSLRASLI
jgi:hypothetical protein